MFSKTTTRSGLEIAYMYDYYPKSHWDSSPNAKQDAYLILNFKNPENVRDFSGRQKLDGLQDKIRNFINVEIENDHIVACVPSSTVGKQSPFHDLIGNKAVIELVRTSTLTKATQGINDNEEIFIDVFF